MKYGKMALLVAGLIGSGYLYAEDTAPPASAYTKEMNAAVYQQLDFNDKQDIEDAKRGFIASLSPQMIKNDRGKTVINLDNWSF